LIFIVLVLSQGFVVTYAYIVFRSCTYWFKVMACLRKKKRFSSPTSMVNSFVVYQIELNTKFISTIFSIMWKIFIVDFKLYNLPLIMLTKSLWWEATSTEWASWISTKNHKEVHPPCWWNSWVHSSSWQCK